MTALSTIDGTRPSDYSLTVSTDSMSALDPSRLSGQRFLDVQSTISVGKGYSLIRRTQRGLCPGLHGGLR